MKKYCVDCGKKVDKRSTRCGSCAKKGENISIETKRKMSEGQKRRKFSEETRKRMSEAHKGRMLSDKHKRKIGEGTLKGEAHPNWNPNLTNEDRIIERHIPGYDDWRVSVYKRDNYTCQKCGNNKGGNLNAHHVESYMSNPDLRTTISNGITLCKKCHLDFHHQHGYGNNTRVQLIKFLGE